MGTIKDVIDLLMPLNDRIKGRKLASEVAIIQTAIFSLQAQQAEEAVRFSDLEDKKAALIAKNAQLIAEKLELQHENAELKKQLLDLDPPDIFCSGAHPRRDHEE